LFKKSLDYNAKLLLLSGMNFELFGNFFEECDTEEAEFSILEYLFTGPRDNHVGELFIIGVPITEANPIL
jgi:hypothetical protein